MGAPVGGGPGRPNQRQRTRKDLLEAAARLVKQGRKPTLEDVAAEALVSRATAYRYFPSMAALLVEASIDVALPEPDALFGADAPCDPVARLELIDSVLDRMMAENEVTLRTMLAQSMEQRIRGEEAAGLPVRQNRRTPLIEAALAPARDRFTPARREMLVAALGVLMGTESMIVFRDVLQLDDEKARKVRRWAIGALVEAAGRKPARGGSSRRARTASRPRS